MAQQHKSKTDTDPRQPGHQVPVYQSNCKTEDEVERAGEDSFPASDPPSYTPVSHPGKPAQKR